MCRPNITEDEDKKKINILRTNFNRENNKLKKSMLSGSGTDDLYVPSVWYFKELQFLQDQMECESGMSTIIEQESSSSTSIPSQSTENTNPLPRKKKKKQEDLQQDLMILARDHFKKPENEYQVMARNWGFKLERMSPDQRRLAEKFINEILFEGEEVNLSRHSVTINPNSTYIPSPTSHTQSSYPHTPSPDTYIPSTTSHTRSPYPHTPSPDTYIPSTTSHTQSPYPHTPSPDTNIPSLTSHIQFPYPQTPSPSTYIPSPTPQIQPCHTQASASQTSVLISTEQTNLPNVEPVMIHITESNPNEAESAATFIKTFSAF